MAMHDHMLFTLWDVEHGLAIWIRTPSGQNHWIDAGYNSTTDFSPAQRVRDYYGEHHIDYLVVSHPDADHINGLPEVLHHLGNPGVFRRNPTLPPSERHAHGELDYQRAFRCLDITYNAPVDPSADPADTNQNGGVEVWTGCLDYRDVSSTNDSSVVCFYLYAGWLFVLPGDIGPVGWRLFRQVYANEIAYFITRSNVRGLVAPHHGRASGFSDEMMTDIDPHVTFVSDKWGQQPTDPRFGTRPTGVTIDGVLTRSLSTKTKGRIQIAVENDGRWFIDFRRTV